MSIELGETSGPWREIDLAAYPLAPPLKVAPLVEAGGINNQVRLVETGAGRYLWKGYMFHADPARILAEHRLLAWLASAGLPFGTPLPVTARDGSTLLPAPDGAGWRALFTWLAGGPLERRNPATITALGAALGTLHQALARLPEDLRTTRTPYGELTNVHPLIHEPYALTPTALGLPEVSPYVEQLAEWRATLAEVAAFIAGPYAELPRQVIHGDFGPGNAMAEGERITAIFDFEFALWDTRALDLAAGLAMTMRIWQLEPWESVALAGAFGRGYAQTNHLTAAEIAALPQLLILREVVAALWWLGRALTAGDARLRLRQLADVRQLVAWLDAHGTALVEILKGEMTGAG